MIGSMKIRFNLEGWPKMARALGAAGLVAMLASQTTACSSTEKEASDEEAVTEEGGDETAASPKEEGEVASTEPAEGAAIAEPAPNATNVAGTNPAGLDPTLAANPADPVEAAPEVPVDNKAPAATSAAPATGPGLPAGTNSVVYVGGERAVIYDAPNGREVGRLVHGDFVLASAEGEWAKTRDGRYVRSGDLQVKPVGRKIVQSRWRSPHSK